MPFTRDSRDRLRPSGIGAVLWLSAFVVYQSTFVSTPRLFLFPEAGMSIADIPEYAAALRGRANEPDIRKHLLFQPMSRGLYCCANWLRLRLGISQDAVALIFPEALYGASSVVVAYLLFLRLMKNRRRAAIAAIVYAYTYSLWIFASFPESYALTLLSISIFLYFIFSAKAEPDLRWSLTTIALIAFCSLCDLRSLLLLILPFYLIARMPGVKWQERIRAVFFITMGTLCLIAAAYHLYSSITGYGSCGIYEMYKWVGGYGGRYYALDYGPGLRELLLLPRRILIEPISPLYPDYLGQSSAKIRGIHLLLICCFVALAAVLTAASTGSIARRVKSCPGLQALACWLAVYIIRHIFSGLLFTPQTVLPLLLLILPGISGALAAKRFGPLLITGAVVTMLLNNLICVNEARRAWQRPGIIATPDDRVYLLPGETERYNFLVTKGYSLLPAAARDRFAELSAKPLASLTARERRETGEISRTAMDRLSHEEREGAYDILRRYREAIRIAEGLH